MVETQIFSETRVVKEEPALRIGKIDSAPPRCGKIQDYYGFDSRGLMNRIFRTYLDKQVITPIELVHNSRELRRLQDKGTLVTAAIDRVAALQTRDQPQDEKSRRDEIAKAVDEMVARARKAEGRHLPKIGDDFGRAVSAADPAGDAEEREFLAGTLLSRDLLGIRSWIGKLDRLCALASAEADPRAMAWLDGAIADVLGTKVVEDLLGWRPSLGSAIRGMLDLADGIAGEEAGADSLEVLNRLFGERRLPLSRHTLIGRAHRQLRSAQPLYRNNPAKNLDELHRTAERLVTPTGLYSGAETAEALTVRCGRMVEQGGSAGRWAAITQCFRTLPDRASGVIYLCDLARSHYADTHRGTMTGLFDLVLAAGNLGELCQRTLSPRDRMARATAAHHAMENSPYPQALKDRVTRHIDGILDLYLLEEQIVERLDHPDSLLRDRAIRLVQFCAAGVLPEGKALTRARERVLSVLRQQSFDAHFVEGIPDPERAQRTLRDFHRLLVKAGFR
ncbi:MAG: hypothetical protein M0006_07205 [Magnetospirillum sp.]|nr:hypothetical protein [Magnetospirillum sp.]